MEISGKIIQALPEVSGTSRAGNMWKKREDVLETADTYPKKVAFTCFGDNADKIQLSVGQEVTVSFDIESREYNGRWYTDIRAWKAEIKSAAPAAAPVGAPMDPIAPPPAPDFSGSNDSDLPF